MSAPRGLCCEEVGTVPVFVELIEFCFWGLRQSFVSPFKGKRIVSKLWRTATEGKIIRLIFDR
jgi:hypothetical protein